MNCDRITEELAQIGSGTGWAWAEDLTVLQLTGSDRLEWLNGQVTNDVRSLKRLQCVEAAFCEPSGQVIAPVAILDDGENSTSVIVPKSRAERLRDIAEAMVVMEDVKGEILSDVAVVRFFGVNISSNVNVLSGSFRSPRGGFLVSGHSDLTIIAPNACGGNAVSGETMDSLKLAWGEPSADAEMSGKCFVAEFGPQFESRAVSDKKGCYVGQEIVARMRTLGKPARRWMAVQTEAEMAVGDTLTDEVNGKLGTVSRVGWLPGLGFFAGTMVAYQNAVPGTHVVSPAGVVGHLQEMPLLADVLPSMNGTEPAS